MGLQYNHKYVVYNKIRMKKSVKICYYLLNIMRNASAHNFTSPSVRIACVFSQ